MISIAEAVCEQANYARQGHIAPAIAGRSRGSIGLLDRFDREATPSCRVFSEPPRSPPDDGVGGHLFLNLEDQLQDGLG